MARASFFVPVHHYPPIFWFSFNLWLLPHFLAECSSTNCQREPVRGSSLPVCHSVMLVICGGMSLCQWLKVKVFDERMRRIKNQISFSGIICCIRMPFILVCPCFLFKLSLVLLNIVCKLNLIVSCKN